MTLNEYKALDISSFSPSLKAELFGYIATGEIINLPASKQRRIHLLIRDKSICHLCKRPILQLSDFNLDHIIPRCKGGTGTRTNLITAHKRCNSIRGHNEVNKFPPEYYIKYVTKARQDKRKQTPRTVNVYFNAQTNYAVELWNEIARYGMTRLSYNSFVDFFEKYRRSVHNTNIEYKKDKLSV